MEGLENLFMENEIQESMKNAAFIPDDIEVYEDVLGEDVVIVTGNPLAHIDRLDYNQGDNSYDAGGSCGLVSSANMMIRCGIETSEEEVVGFAIENGLCTYSPFMPSESNGGTNDFAIEAVLESYGVEVTAYTGASVEDIAMAIDEGRAVSIGVNAGYLWHEADFVDDGSVNHQVLVTGAVRNTNGEVIGLVICDSGRGLESDASRVVSVEELELCYEMAGGSSAMITDYAVN